MKKKTSVNNPNYKHGMRGTRFYRIFSSMKSRCKNKNDNRCRNYGYKGISVKWNNFIMFKEDMYNSYLKHIKTFGEKNTTIDRIDNNKNYCKVNCRWATRKEQNNNASSNIVIKFRNKKQTLQQWAEELGFKRACLYKRIKERNWKIEKALTTPSKKKYALPSPKKNTRTESLEDTNRFCSWLWENNMRNKAN